MKKHLTFFEGTHYYSRYSNNGQIMFLLLDIDENNFQVNIYYSPDNLPDYFLIGTFTENDRSMDVVGGRVNEMISSPGGVMTIQHVIDNAENFTVSSVDENEPFIVIEQDETEKDIFMKGTNFSLS